MSKNIFNLYSSVIYSQHPLALWNLDEDFSFLSLIGASPVWQIINGSSGSIANPPAFKPQETVGIAEEFLELDNFIASSSEMTLTTQSFDVPGDIDVEKTTVCFNSFIYTYNSDILQLDIGFDIDGNKDVTTYTNLSTKEWTRISHTAILSASGTFTPYINVVFSGTERSISLYRTSVGQWSENYNHETSGAIAQPFSSVEKSFDIASCIGGEIFSFPEKFKVLPADVYGFREKLDGYYFVEDNKMLVRNTSLPMVFGSGDITEIYPSPSGNPSLIFPGKGFFHFEGKNKSYTAEFWLKIYPQSNNPVKIFGSLVTKDGLYVDKEFLTLKLGPYEQSYFIHKWYRPMLIHIRYSKKFVSVMINGDIVIEQEIIPEDIDFPDSTTFDSDWVGFYSDLSIVNMEIDSFSIFPYEISEQLAKKNFVYGQGVGQPNEITTRFSGTTHTVDFAFSNYTNNLIYPEMINWSTGFISNMSPEARTLSLPEYDLPEIIYGGPDVNLFNKFRSKRTWGGVLQAANDWATWTLTTWASLSRARELDPLFDNFVFQNVLDKKPHIKLRPSPSYQNLYGAITFDSFSILTDPVESFLCLFSYKNEDFSDTEEMTLVQILNRETQDNLQIILNISTQSILYLFNDTLLKSTSFVPDDEEKYFIAGMDVGKIKKSYNAVIRKFFDVPQNLEVKVGGTEERQFSGSIYNIHFNNGFFTKKDISEYFDNQGIAQVSNSSEVLSSDFIIDYIGNYSLLFKKTNQSLVMDIGVSGYWEDSIPLSRLGSFVQSGGRRKVYDLDLIQFNIDAPSKIFTRDNFDESQSVNCYVSLQSFQDAGRVSYLSLNNIKDLDEQRYINFENINTNIDTTKFRVVDGTIIFPPKRIINFDSAYITIHIEAKSLGTQTSSVSLQKLALSSLAFDETSLYPIKTTTGSEVFPFSRIGQVYTPKLKNPFLIGKGSVPYLYLTGDSGITALPYPDFDEVAVNTAARGLSFPINPNQNLNYNFDGATFWFAYNKRNEILEKEKIFSIFVFEKRYNFYVEPEPSNKRAKITVYEANTVGVETTTSNFDIFENGIKKEVYVRPLSWSLIGLVPKNSIVVDGVVGQFEIYPGALVNNVTFYQQNIEKEVDDIFESHLGLSNIVVEDPSSVLIESDTTRINSNIEWSIFAGKPL
jgi:hypothetical protein